MSKEHEESEMLPEYDFTKGVRGKYAVRCQAGSNIVVLADDVAQAFPTAEAFNQALRLLIQLAQQNVRKQTG